MGLVYGIRNLLSGFVYVGCTKGNLNKRMREHRCLLNSGIHTATKMQEDWSKHGASAFRIEILEEISVEASVVYKRERELHWMKHFADTGLLYNAFQTSFAPDESARIKGVEAARLPNSKRMTEVWRNPEYRAKRISQMRAGYDRRNQMRANNIVSSAPKGAGPG